jgi:hypothetical protein
MSKRRRIKVDRAPKPLRAPRPKRSKNRAPTTVGSLAQRIFEPRGPKASKGQS